MLDREVKFENLKEMLQKSVEKFGDEAAFYPGRTVSSGYTWKLWGRLSQGTYDAAL